MSIFSKTRRVPRYSESRRIRDTFSFVGVSSLWCLLLVLQYVLTLGAEKIRNHHLFLGTVYFKPFSRLSHIL